MRYDICPVPKPRMTRADQWRKRPIVQRYWEFKRECQFARVRFSTVGSRIEFGLPMPESWSKSKRALMRGTPHQSKPDLDNLLKGLCDAVYPENDAMISSIYIEKVWAEKGYIEID